VMQETGKPDFKIAGESVQVLFSKNRRAGEEIPTSSYGKGGS